MKDFIINIHRGFRDRFLSEDTAGIRNFVSDAIQLIVIAAAIASQIPNLIEM